MNFVCKVDNIQEQIIVKVIYCTVVYYDNC